MSNIKSSWQPKYTITTSIARHLMQVEAVKVFFENTSIPVTAYAELLRNARVRSTHYSTRIEGNRLTLQEADEVISHRRTDFLGRERDVLEVQHYWDALVRLEQWAAMERHVTEDIIKRFHSIVMGGSRAKAQDYRDGQNVIRDSQTGAIVYMPPEASDVPSLMGELVEWVAKANREGVPAVVISGLVHYQLATIHPYYDGNGRTARLLSSFILHRSGYGLGGLFSLEECHARDLDAYYHALDVGGHHNYYMGRAEADLTDWLEYFISVLAVVFEEARDNVRTYISQEVSPIPDELRSLDRRARMVIGIFLNQETITVTDVSRLLGLSDRMARVLLKEWVADGWLVIANPSNRARSYSLHERYRRYLESPNS